MIGEIVGQLMRQQPAIKVRDPDLVFLRNVERDYGPILRLSRRLDFEKLL